MLLEFASFGGVWALRFKVWSLGVGIGPIKIDLAGAVCQVIEESRRMVISRSEILRLATLNRVSTACAVADC